jgi:antitoxin PrlF
MEGGGLMELAKVTSKGQITIPVSIRRKLRLKEGDKLLFLEDEGRVYILNPSYEALEEVQQEFTGVAEQSGINDEGEVVELIKNYRRHKREK